MDHSIAPDYGGIVPPGRVLIVDDDDDVRALHQDAMERHGYEVVAVGGGAEALAFLDRDVPSIVLLDLHMDDGNGWEVLGAVRGHPRFANTRVVVITGSMAPVSPPTKVLRKPFKFAALLAALDQKVAS
ncbi:MAG: response regulator [Myxococcales bacterium]|nr:response regulator [Myxococcales bacterium]